MIDPLTVGVVNGAVTQALSEALVTFGQLAFSPIITEGHDYGVGLYARDSGELLAVDHDAFPLFVWLGQAAVRAVLDAEPEGAFASGDVYLVNDPYLSGTHMHDVKAVAPIFFRGELMAFLCVTGHWTDIGGPSPGGFATEATEIYQEGLRIPPVKVLAGGNLVEGVIAVLMSNVRLPVNARGDLMAQLSTIQVAVDRIAVVLERFGRDTFFAALESISAAGEEEMRARIAAMPDGKYEYEDWLDNDGINHEPIRVNVCLEVAREQLIVDFSRSSLPVQGAFNVPAITTRAAVIIAVHHVFPEALLTGGGARAISVLTGNTFLGASFPRACEAYGEVCCRIVDAVHGALWQAVPDRVCGGNFGTANNLSIGGTDLEGNPYIMYAYLGGGHGASREQDGLTNASTAIGVALTPQIETYEHLYPVRYREYAIRENSGGIGEFRGGFGVVWEVEILGGSATMSAMADRASRGASGALGGGPGAAAELEIIRSNGRIDHLEHLTKCQNYPLSAGDRVRRLSPGGGGFGDPHQRSPQHQHRDSERGYVSTHE